MAIIKIDSEDSAIPNSLIKEISFDDQTALGTIKIDYYYLMALCNTIMDKIPADSLEEQDSLGEQVLRNFIIEYMQLTEKLAKISEDCDKEEAVEEANNIVTGGREC